MGRTYGPDAIYRMLDRLRDGVPGLFLRTSLIVGFPGETRAAYDRLLRFVDEARWDYLGVFPYSREEGTSAFGMPSQVPERTKEERARRVRDAQADLLSARNASRIGQTLDVLVEKAGARGKAVGRHRGQAPEVDGSMVLSGFDGKPGSIVRARVTGAREWDLRGVVVRSGSSESD
jgi:ribosomal protein S12 methylthiotransferase